MRTLRWMIPLTFLPALAVAQEAPSPPATGTVLLEAAPSRADLLLHTPHLHGLLQSGSEAGLGDAGAWRKALRDQAEAWAEDPERRQEMGDAALKLLRLADGEALLAASRVPGREGAVRAFVLAFRSTAKGKALARPLGAVIDAGLRGRYPGELTEETILGRKVQSLAGVHRRLYFHARDGLCVISDHALAMGVLFRGIERTVSAGNRGAKVGKQLLEVRYGPPSTRWTGWMFGAAESVSWIDRVEAKGATAPLLSLTDVDPPERPVVMVALASLRDVPLLPVPCEDWVAGAADGLKPWGPAGLGLMTRPDGGSAVVSRVREGTRVVDLSRVALDRGPVTVTTDVWTVGWPIVGGNPHPGPDGPGGAGRLAWLSALAAGTLPCPIPGVDAQHLAGPLAAARTATADGASPFIHWSSGGREGELRGSAWHGPATFLALRTLRHIAYGIAPGETAPPQDEYTPPKRPGPPLPDPVPPREKKDE